jgi:4-amino-4-deoxy-L-arabinose transferase-like glycosyltransferase
VAAGLRALRPVLKTIAEMPRPLVATIVGLSVAHALVAGMTRLTDDEAYYRLWSLAPAMSYYDHPPMVAWMMAAGRWLAGDTPLGIRLAAVLASLVGPFLLWRTAAILFNRDVSERSVWLALAMPLLAVGSIVMTPDTPSVLFWGLAAWALAELHVSRDANWWLEVGLFAGLGLLSKYTNLFVGAGIVVWLIVLPANWPWLRRWQLWGGGILACLLAFPVIFWNLQHEWASIRSGRTWDGADVSLSTGIRGRLSRVGEPHHCNLLAVGAGAFVSRGYLARPESYDGRGWHLTIAGLFLSPCPKRPCSAQLGGT